MIKNLFTEHPRKINETYLQHLRYAFIFGVNFLRAGFACILHGLFPFLFEKTASTILLGEMRRFIARHSAEERLKLIDWLQQAEK